MSRSVLRTVLLGITAVTLLAVFLNRFLLVELLVRRVGVALILAVAATVACVAAGAAARMLLSRWLPAPKEQSLSADFLVGYPIFGSLCFLAGLISTGRAMSAVLLVGGVIAGGYLLRTYRRNSPATDIITRRGLVAIGLFAVAVLIAAVNSLLPAVTLDEAAYHLAVPKLWILEGRVVELPLLSHSYFPFGVESADLPLLSLLGDSGVFASHALHLIAMLATCSILFSAMRRRIDGNAAAVFLAVVATTPAILAIAGFSWVDWPLLGIVLVLLISLDETSELHSEALAACAIAAGLLTKYTFVPIAIAIFASALRTSEREARRPLLRAVGIGSAIGSLFYVRNLLLTWNPFAPFLQQNAPHVSAYRTAEDIVASYIFDGRFIDESIAIALPLLAVAALLSWRSGVSAGPYLSRVALFSAGVIAVFLLLRPSARILVPALVLVAYTGFVVAEALAGPRGRRVLEAGLIFIALLQLFVAGFYSSTLRPFEVLGGSKDDRSWLRSQRPAVAVVESIDQSLPDGSRTLVIGVQELYWFSHSVRGGGNFDGPRVSRYLEHPDLVARLRRDGFTHIAVVPQGVAIGAPPNDPKTAERLTVITATAAGNLERALRTADVVTRVPRATLWKVPYN